MPTGSKTADLVQPTPAAMVTPEQQAASPVPGSNLGDIVVTARRTAERLQSVPLAVTALNPAALQQNHITQTSDLRLVAPSLQITPTVNGGSVPGVMLRGQRSARALFGQDPSVAVYINEVPQTRAAGLDSTTYDLASVQVLKGPQGTLFGRNTTGGALLFTSQRPTDRFEGFLDGTIGDYRDRELTGAVNVPINAQLQLRFAGNITRRRGYALNVVTGQHLFDRHSESGRATLKWTPSPSVESLLIADVYHSNSNGTLARGLGVIPGGTLERRDLSGSLNTPTGTADASNALLLASNIWTLSSNEIGFDRTRSRGVENISSVAMTDHLTLKNILGYRSVRSYLRGEYDGTAAAGVGTDGIQLGKWGSEELQVIGKFPTVDLIAGLFLYTEKGTDFSIGNNFQARGSDNINFTGGYGNNQSFSIYSQGTVKLDRVVHGLSLTVGGRYSIDDRQVTADGHSVQTIPVMLSVCNTRDPQTAVLKAYPDCGVTVSKTFSKPTYNISLNEQLSKNLLLYVAHRLGYRSGGFNIRALNPSDFAPFKPETVRDVEVGVKTDFRIGGVKGRLNLAAYNQWYSNIQRSVQVLTPGVGTSSTIFNAAKATINGGEVELVVEPVRGLSLTGNYALINAKYQRYVNPVDQADLSHNKFADVPTHQGSVSLRYTQMLGPDIGSVSVSGTVYAQSKFYFSDVNYVSPYGSGIQKGYHLVNARVEWTKAFGRPLSLAVFGSNLTNTQYILSGNATTAVGAIYGYPGAPRMYGFEARYDF